VSCLSGYEYDATLNTCNFIKVGSSDITNIIIGMVVGTVGIFMLFGMVAFLYLQYKESPTVAHQT
jgi:hypothetical protein